MKAKHFKKIRKKARHYEVVKSEGLFGGPFRGKPCIVLARNPVEAIRRARRRGWFTQCSFAGDYAPEMWAKFRVKFHGTSDHWRNFVYLN